MKVTVVGLDLAGNPKNESGYCLLYVEGGVKAVQTKLLHSDEEILSELMTVNPDLIAVDAPLIYGGQNRKCDELLHGYGALPVTLRGMEVLARRGSGLAKELSRLNMKFIEVYSTASAKILGIYSKDDFSLQKNMMALGLQGDFFTRILTRDELDSVLAAITGYLYLEKQTKEVGDESGVIVVPEV